MVAVLAFAGVEQVPEVAGFVVAVLAAVASAFDIADAMVEQACMLIVLVTAEQFALGALVFSAGVEQVRRQQRAIEFNGREVAALVMVEP